MTKTNKPLSWQDLSQLLRLVLDFYGVDYRVNKLYRNERYTADCFHFKAHRVDISLECISGTVSDPEIELYVGTDKDGPVFRLLHVGDFSIYRGFPTLCLDIHWIAFCDGDDRVRVILDEH